MRPTPPGRSDRRRPGTRRAADSPRRPPVRCDREGVPLVQRGAGRGAGAQLRSRRPSVLLAAAGCRRIGLSQLDGSAGRRGGSAEALGVDVHPGRHSQGTLRGLARPSPAAQPGTGPGRPAQLGSGAGPPPARRSPMRWRARCSSARPRCRSCFRRVLRSGRCERVRGQRQSPSRSDRQRRPPVEHAAQIVADQLGSPAAQGAHLGLGLATANGADDLFEFRARRDQLIGQAGLQRARAQQRLGERDQRRIARLGTGRAPRRARSASPRGRARSRR